MPILFSYLLKLSCSLAVAYLFYQLALRRLTFYNANRWYLLGYSLLCFFIPLLNIAHLMEQHQLNHFKVVQVIPAIETYTATSKAVMQPAAAASFNAWDGALWLIALGAIVLLARLVIQYISLRKLSRCAQLVADDGIKMYHVNKDIIPFSFGNAIFINQLQHSEAELQEIIRHEFVHVKQRHTIDVLFAELLCILNWYNPAAWAIRHAVRQNLEFIADRQVLQSGFDKKEYQYLLLKVIGLSQFRIATPFNFSSLKKRIVMMNKMKSAKAHLVKFLFMLPLLAILLVAFRNVTDKQNAKKPITFTVSGLVIDAATQAPLANVALSEVYSKVTATTDDHGYFSVAIPIAYNPMETQIHFSKEGFETVKSLSSITFNKLQTTGTIEVIGMKRIGDKKNRWFIQSYALSDKASFSVAPTYDEVLKNFMQTKAAQEQQKHAPKAGQKKITDTVPAPPPPPPAVAIVTGPSDSVEFPDEYKDFLARNPDVAAIRWTERDMIIELKSGKKESYPRNDAKRMAEAEKKWGILPMAPPPPPPPPTVTPPKGEGPVSGVSKAVEKQEALAHIQEQHVQLNKLAQQKQMEKQLQLQKTVSVEQDVQLKKELAELQVQQRQENIVAIKKQIQAIAEQKPMPMQLKEQQDVQEMKLKAQEQVQKQEEVLKKKQETSHY